MKTAEEKRAYFQQHYRKNADRKKAYQRAYSAAHPEVVRANNKIGALRRAQSPGIRDKEKEKDRATYAVNLEASRAYRREVTARWRKRYPVTSAYVTGARRAAYASGNLTDAQWLEITAAWQGRCAYCGNAANTIDHVTPLRRGGRHDSGNVVPACRSCNSSKGALLPIVFIWRRADPLRCV